MSNPLLAKLFPQPGILARVRRAARAAPRRSKAFVLERPDGVCDALRGVVCMIPWIVLDPEAAAPISFFTKAASKRAALFCVARLRRLNNDN